MTQRFPTFVRGLSIVVANCIPLVGVTAWGWDLWLLLVVYIAEAAFSVIIAATKALFAEQRSPGGPGPHEPLHELREKRGSFQHYSNWLQIYPRNVSAGLAVSIAALLFSQIEEFVAEYIGTGEYRDVSAQELIRTPAQLTPVLLFLGFSRWVGPGPVVSTGLSFSQ